MDFIILPCLALFKSFQISKERDDIAYCDDWYNKIFFSFIFESIV